MGKRPGRDSLATGIITLFLILGGVRAAVTCGDMGFRTDMASLLGKLDIKVSHPAFHTSLDTRLVTMGASMEPAEVEKLIRAFNLAAWDPEDEIRTMERRLPVSKYELGRHMSQAGRDGALLQPSTTRWYAAGADRPASLPAGTHTRFSYLLVAYDPATGRALVCACYSYG